MKPSSERKAELERRITQAVQSGSAAALADALIDTIDQTLRDRNRPGRRDREADDRDRDRR